MKSSNTTIRELTAQYRSILRKCFLLNSTILMGITLATPVMAGEAIIASQNETLQGLYSGYDTNGAVIIQNGVTGVTVADGTIFKSNSSSETSISNASSGALTVSEDLRIGENVQFDTNFTLTKGGAVLLKAGNLTIEEGTQFTNNYAPGGGAIAIIEQQDSDSPTLNLNSVVFKGNESISGGAIYSESGTININNSEFSGNTAENSGGAIYVSNTNLNIQNSSFIGNGADLYGAAIVVSNSVDSGTKSNTITINKSSFIGNKSQSSAIMVGTGDLSQMTITDTIFEGNESSSYAGGAISISNATPTLTLSGVTFKGNRGLGGGALFSRGMVSFNNVKFIENSSTSDAGAVGVMNNMNFGNNLEFIRNSADRNGGAVHIYEDSMTSSVVPTVSFGLNTLFEGNSSFNSGGAVSIASGNVTFGEGTQFIGNTSMNGGGISIYGSATASSSLSLQSVTFTQNQANYGGAVDIAENAGNVTINGSQFIQNNSVYNGGALNIEPEGTSQTTTLNNSAFNGNVAGGRGGAIYVTGNGTLNIDKGVFTGNEAHIGGSIFADSSNNLSSNLRINISNTVFENNKSVSEFGGGAIYLYQASKKADGNLGTNIRELSLSGVTFKNNTGAYGGAILNGENNVINLTNTNIFTGNSAVNGGNDIFNAGDLNVNGGTTIIDGGISGTGNLTVASGATLNIGTATVEQHTITFNSNSVLNVSLLNPSSYGSLNVVTKVVDSSSGSPVLEHGTFSGTTNTAVLNLAIGAAGTYDVLVGTGAVGVFKTSSLAANASLFNVTEDTSNLTKLTYIATPKTTNEIEADLGVDTQTAQFLNAMANGQTEDINRITLNMQNEMAAGNQNVVTDVLTEVAPTEAAVLQSLSTSVHSQILSAISNRFSLPIQGRAGGDLNAQPGPWVQGLYDRAEQKSSSSTAGFHGYTKGIAFGADGVITNNLTIGAGYAYNVTDVKSGGRKTDIDGHNFFVYGEYQPSAWFVNAALSYGMSDYEENSNVLGVQVKGKYDVQTWGGQVMAGYDTCLGITPEAGLRYLNIRQDSYTDSIGQRVEADNINLLTAVVGAKYGYDFAQKNYTVSPEIRLAATYDVVSDDADATVVMGNGSYTTTAEALERFGVEAGVGLTMSLYNALDLSLNYNAGIRKDYTNQMGTVKLKYNF